MKNSPFYYYSKERHENIEPGSRLSDILLALWTSLLAVAAAIVFTSPPLILLIKIYPNQLYPILDQLYCIITFIAFFVTSTYVK